MRKQDRLSAIELHGHDAARSEGDTLRGRFSRPGDRARRLAGAWRASAAEKRGLVLVDPPFQKQASSIASSTDCKAHRRWPGGIYAASSIKGRKAIHRLQEGAEVRDTEAARPDRDQASVDPSLDGSGMVVVSPPFTLESELRILLPALHKLLADEVGALDAGMAGGGYRSAARADVTRRPVSSSKAASKDTSSGNCSPRSECIRTLCELTIPGCHGSPSPACRVLLALCTPLGTSLRSPRQWHAADLSVYSNEDSGVCGQPWL